jgi:TonB-dependent starch-binding outer membrane protein SusC
MRLKTIVLFLTFSCSTASFGQVKINGIVKEKSGLPIPLANVFVKGTKTSTTTDFDGKYSISVSSQNAELVFSYTGFGTKTIKVGAKTEIDVFLEEDSKTLDEVVVVGYATIKKKDVTNSVSSVKGKDLQTMTVGNATESLQGKVAGVQITGAGNPGGQPRVLIRGISSVNLSSDPLYVVDGVPFVNGINFLNNNEIESLDVLKDASAAAIYGSRASNGVILVTTKKGKIGAPKFNVDVSNGYQVFQKPYITATAENYANIINTSFENSGEAAIFKETEQYRGKTTNWWDAGIENISAVTNASIGVSGGSDKNTYNLTLNYFNSESFYKIGKYSRFTVRAVNDYKFSDKVSAGIIINPRYETYGGPDFWRDFIRIDPITPIYKPILTGTENEYSVYSRSPSGVWNPVANVNRFDNYTDQYNLNLNSYLQYEPIKGFVIRTQASYEFGSQVNSSFTPDYVVDPSFESNLLNRTQRIIKNNMDWAWQTTATYSKTIAKKHNASLMLGNAMEERNGVDLDGYGEGLPNNLDATRELNAATKNFKAGGNSYSESILSYFSRLSYNFDSKYYLTASVRRDGSSKFAPENRWGLFPAISASWRVSNENFIKDIAFISDLRLRGGWGKVGNQRIGNSTFISKVGQNFYVDANGNTIVTSFPSSSANKDIVWETVEDSNLGIDFGVFKNKFTGSVEYYEKKTIDMLFNKTFPAHAGLPNFNRILSNIGSMRSNGFDVLLSYKNKKNNFSYSADVTFTTVQTEMLALSSDGERLFEKGERSLTIQGDEPGFFYGFIADGLFQNQSEINSHTDNNGNLLQRDAVPGDVRFRDLNGDGKLDPNDRTKIGSPWPDYNMGLNLSFTYKNIDLLFNFYASIGGELVNENIQELYNGANITNKISGLENIAWHGEGTSTKYPRLAINDLNQNYIKFSSLYIEDGSFVRLKNIQLGYTLPKLSGFSKIRFSISGQNILTWTKFTGIDPEVGAGGGALTSGHAGYGYPVLPTIFVGLNAGF